MVLCLEGVDPLGVLPMCRGTATRNIPRFAPLLALGVLRVRGALFFPQGSMAQASP